MQQNKQEKSITGIFSELSGDVIYLIRQEIEFAKTEMSTNIRKALSYAFLVACGGAFALTALLVLFTGITNALSELVSPLMAAIVVSVFVGNFGLLLMGVGLYKFWKGDFVPRRTIRLVQEEAEWIKNQAA